MQTIGGATPWRSAAYVFLVAETESLLSEGVDLPPRAEECQGRCSGNYCLPTPSHAADTLPLGQICESLIRVDSPSLWWWTFVTQRRSRQSLTHAWVPCSG